ncbi:hypothetical protein E2C01_008595 [Portunus trituberculatus]|uniref:SGNH hydrolase-type esterase domain-containing protein n=1 Tax=Portunus trituberculatus TaxID=210409 RepID=A0A5B7D166_PORTR|nr:hypothetical protein [Portunus trituberculatus]
MDRTEGGASITRIEEIFKETMHGETVHKNDYVVIEGGGNGLTSTGVSKTLDTIERMVKMASEKVKRNIVVMNIPMRRGKELSEFDKMRKTVNKECIKKLREWNCDGIQLSEKVEWQEVWGRDGKHLRFRAQLSVAMIIEEWINFRNKKYTTGNDVENKTNP